MKYICMKPIRMSLLKERVTFQTPVILILGIGYRQIPSAVFIWRYQSR